MVVFRRAPADSEKNGSDSPTHDKDMNGSFDLIDQWLRIVVWAFLKCGIVEVCSCPPQETYLANGRMQSLVRVVEQQVKHKLGRKAAVLLGEILQLATRLLPTESTTPYLVRCSQNPTDKEPFLFDIQTLPRLFALATDYKDAMPWFAATTALGSVDSVGRKLRRTEPSSSRSQDKRARSNSLEEVESSKIRMGMALDDQSFRNLLLETQVLTAKDDTRWNFDVLTDLLEGPLMNPKRMEEVIKSSKLMRRLLTFFHPHEHRYSTMPRTSVCYGFHVQCPVNWADLAGQQNVRFTKFGCSLLMALLASPEGIRLLSEDKLLRQISDGLLALENVCSIFLSGVVTQLIAFLGTLFGQEHGWRDHVLKAPCCIVDDGGLFRDAWSLDQVRRGSPVWILQSVVCSPLKQPSQASR